VLFARIEDADLSDTALWTVVMVCGACDNVHLAYSSLWTVEWLKKVSLLLWMYINYR